MINNEFKISICMIVKNEEKNLERCLESIIELVKLRFAEIIIVDTGSTDNTIDIAKKYTDKVYLHKWKNDFSEARNYSISMAKGEYIFILDADEELESDGLRKIIDFFNKEDYESYCALYFKEKNFMDFSLKEYGVFTRAFIFKNTKDFCYFGAIHEQPNIKGKRMNLDIYILHYGYINDKKLQEEKYKRNITMLKEEIKKEPNNLYIRYQSAISYFAHKDLKEAKGEIDIVLKTIQNNKFDKLNLLYYDAAVRIYKENGLYEEALDLCNIGLSYQSDFIDLIFYKITLLFTMNNAVEVIKTMDIYLELLNEFKTHDIYNDPRFLFYHLDSKDEAINMGLVSWYETRNYIKFIKYVNQVQDVNILKNKMYIIIEVYLNSDNYYELIEFYNKKIIKDEKTKNIFDYFMWKRFNEEGNEEIQILKDKLKFEYSKEDYEKLQYNFIDVYNFGNADIITTRNIINDLIKFVNNYNINDQKNKNKSVLINKVIKFIITRTLNSNQIKDISSETIFEIIEKYLELGLTLKNDEKILEEKESVFFKLFEQAIYKFQSGELLQAVQIIKESVEEYNYAARIMERYLDKYIPIYEGYIQMKNRIQSLIEIGNLNEAKIMLNDYKIYLPQDPDNYSISAVIKIMENDLEKAKEILEKGVEKHYNNFDLIYNLAYVYENIGEIPKAIEYYEIALEKSNTSDIKNSIKNKLKEIYKFK